MRIKSLFSLRVIRSLSCASLLVVSVTRGRADPTVDGYWRAALLPPARMSGCMATDPVNGRLLLFGGTRSTSGALQSLNDVWERPLSGGEGWLSVITAGTPPSPRSGASMIVDPVRQRMIVFGGLADAGYQGDVFALSLGTPTPTWTTLSPGGTAPIGRAYQSAIYDPAGDRMVMFGGNNASGANNEVWVLGLGAGGAWQRLTPSGTAPSPRRGAGIGYEPSSKRFVVVGGGPIVTNMDVWALTLSPTPSWSPLPVSGTPPAAREFFGFESDGSKNRFWLQGGTGAVKYDDTWVLDLSDAPAWQPIVASPRPQPRGQHMMAFDALRDQLLIFGGVGGVVYNDFWSLSAQSPTAYQSLGPADVVRAGHSMILDPVRGRYLMFGGRDAFFTPRNEVFVSSSSGTEGWQLLATVGTPPSPRYLHNAVYDPLRDRMLVFWGVAQGTNGLSLSNEVWQLTLSDPPTWSLLPINGTPAGRRSSPVVYDPLRDRMLFFSGITEGALWTTELWSLSLGQVPGWALLTTSGPSGRYAHSLSYDGAHDRLVLFGGDPQNNQLWSYAFNTQTWSQLNALGTPPSARFEHAAVIDARRDRMIVFGGIATGIDDHVYALSLAAPESWADLAPGSAPVGRASMGAAYDQPNDRMRIHGGNQFNPSRVLADTWDLQWVSTLGVDPLLSGGAMLASAFPNPARSGVELRYRLAMAGPTSLRVYDVNGRLVRSLVEAVEPAGERSVHWDRRTDSGVRVRPGLYFYELRSGPMRETKRIAVE